MTAASNGGAQRLATFRAPEQRFADLLAAQEFHQIQKFVVSQITVQVAEPGHLDRYRNILAMETLPRNTVPGIP